MKTAISVDDGLMERADQAAEELGLSRSGLVAEALREFLQKRRDAQITDQLNAVYGEDDQAVERELVRKMRTKLSVADTW